MLAQQIYQKPLPQLGLLVGVVTFVACIGVSGLATTSKAQGRFAYLSNAILQEKAKQQQGKGPVENAPRIRIGIMPVEGSSKFKGIDEKLQRKLLIGMKTQTSHHSVRLNGSQFAKCNRDWVEKGTYPIEALAKASEIYHVERVIFMRINEWSPFEPMSMGITFHLVDSHDAKLLVSEDRHWTLQDPTTKEEYRQYLCERFKCQGNVEIYFRTPSYFCDFVADKISKICDVR